MALNTDGIHYTISGEELDQPTVQRIIDRWRATLPAAEYLANLLQVRVDRD